MFSFKNLLKLFLLIVIAALLFAACDKDSSTNPTEHDAEQWIEHPYFFREHKILLNGQSFDDHISIAGLTYATSLDTNFTSGSLLYLTFDNSMLYKPAFYDYMSVNKGYKSSIGLCAMKDGFEGGGFRDYIDFDQLNLGYSQETLPAADNHTEPIGIFNNDGVFCTVLKDTLNGGYSDFSFCIIDLGITYNYYNDIILDPTALRLNYSSSGYSEYIHMDSYNSDFFVSMVRDGSPELLKISPDGNQTTCNGISGTVEDFLALNDTLYVLTNNSEIYRSFDEGISWQLWTNSSSTRNAVLFEVDGHLCFFDNGTIATIDKENGEIHQLANKGVDDVEITSASLFDNHVFLTTLSGLFYKHVDDFFALEEN